MKRKKRNLKIHFSRNRNDWATPQPLFDAINKKYGPFTLDAAAESHNKKCPNFCTEKENGLRKIWSGHSKVWVNPPYNLSKEFIQKAYNEAQDGCRVVMLLPARTDTIAFHEYIMKAKHVHLIKGRIKFEGAKDAAPFPSMIVVFEKGKHTPKFKTWRMK